MERSSLPCQSSTASTCPTMQAEHITSQAPTSQAPTSPTSQAPTSQAPTSLAPTSLAPTSLAPTPLATTSQAQISQAPTSQAPTSQSPTSQAPTSQAPTSQAPTSQAPTSQAPTSQDPLPQAQAPHSSRSQAPPQHVPSLQSPAPLVSTRHQSDPQLAQHPPPHLPLTTKAPPLPPQTHPLQVPQTMPLQSLPLPPPVVHTLAPLAPLAPAPVPSRSYQPWNGGLHFTSQVPSSTPSTTSRLPSLDLSIFKSNETARKVAEEQAGIVTKISQPTAPSTQANPIDPVVTSIHSSVPGHIDMTSKSELVYGAYSSVHVPATQHIPSSYNVQSNPSYIVSAEPKPAANQMDDTNHGFVYSAYPTKAEAAMSHDEAATYSIHESAVMSHLEPEERQKFYQIVSQLQRKMISTQGTATPAESTSTYRQAPLLPTTTTSIPALPYMGGVTSNGAISNVTISSTAGISHVTSAGVSHVTSAGISHVTSAGNSHVTSAGISHVTSAGISHVTSAGISHVTSAGISHSQIPAPLTTGAAFVEYSERAPPMPFSGKDPSQRAPVIAAPMPFSPVKDLQWLEERRVAEMMILKNHTLDTRLLQEYHQKPPEARSELYKRPEPEKTVLPPAKTIFSSEHSVLPSAMTILSHLPQTLTPASQSAYQGDGAKGSIQDSHKFDVSYSEDGASYAQSSSKVLYSQSPSPLKAVYSQPAARAVYAQEPIVTTYSQPVLSGFSQNVIRPPSNPQDIALTYLPSSKPMTAQANIAYDDASRNLQELARVVQLQEGSKLAYDPKVVFSHAPTQIAPQNIYSKSAATVGPQEMSRTDIQGDVRSYPEDKIAYSQGQATYVDTQGYAHKHTQDVAQHGYVPHLTGLPEEQTLKELQVYKPQPQSLAPAQDFSRSGQDFNSAAQDFSPSAQHPTVVQPEDPISSMKQGPARKRKYLKKEPKPKKPGPQYHKQTLSRDAPYKCAICGKGFQKERGLQDHMWHYHSDFRPVKCEVCDERFCSKDRLVDHMRQHNPKTFVCEQCGKAFKTNGHLKQHGKVHTKLSAYPCTMCDRVFEKEGFLKQHYLKHTDNRPNQCGICKKVYKNQKYLNSHFIKYHPTEQFLKCEECDDLYLQQEQLDEHKKSHEEARERSKQINNKLSEQELCKIMQEDKVKTLQQKVSKAKGVTSEAAENDSSSEKKSSSILAATSDGSIKAGESVAEEGMKQEAGGQGLGVEEEELQYPCLLCSVRYPARQALVDHVMSTHPTAPDGTTHCFVCRVTFKGSKRFQSHMVRHVESRRYVCRLCGTTCATRTTYALHCEQQHGQAAAFPCTHCGKAYYTEASLKEHAKQHAPRPFTCPLCPATFRKEWQYTDHMHDDHQITRPFVCKLCSKSYVKAKAFHKHMAAMHSDAEQPPRKKRKSAAAEKPGLQSPVKSEHSDDRAYQAHGKKPESNGRRDDDSGSLETAGALGPIKPEGSEERKQTTNTPMETGSSDEGSNSVTTEHESSGLGVATTGTESTVHQCSMCEETFATLDQLTKHITDTYFTRTNSDNGNSGSIAGSSNSGNANSSDSTSNSDNFEIRCEICSSTFRRVSSLRDHLLHNHASARPHACPDCGATFATKPRLLSHARLHQQKNVICELCGKAFKSASHLKAHQATHAKVTRHQCNVCGRVFKKEGFLKQHELKHVDKRPYQCGVCKKVFKNQEYLNNHLRKEHPGEQFLSCDRCADIFLDEADFKAHKEKHEKDDRNAEMNEQTNKKLPQEEIMKLLKKTVDEEPQSKAVENDIASQDIAKAAEGMIDTMEKDSASQQPSSSKVTKRRVRKPSRVVGTAPDNVHEADECTDGRKRGMKRRLIPCTECGKFFTSLADVRTHTRENHPPTSDSKTPGNKDSLKCATCSKAFRNKRSLDMHVKNCVKASSSAFKCTVCGKQCDGKPALRKHTLEAHKRGGRKPRGGGGGGGPQKMAFACVCCGRSYETGDALSAHVCAGVESFRCRLCNVGFHGRRALNDHLFSHTGERPVGCEQCGQNFSRLRDMRQHQRTVHAADDAAAAPQTPAATTGGSRDAQTEHAE